MRRSNVPSSLNNVTYLYPAPPHTMLFSPEKRIL